MLKAGGFRRGGACRQQIETFGVILYHPVGAETPTETRDGVLDPLDPVVGKTVRTRSPVKGDHLVCECLIEIFGVSLVLHIQIVVHAAMTDGKAVLPVVGLAPPAIKDGEVQTPVEKDLLTAGAACIQRSPGGVQPDVHALNQLPRHVVVIVFHEDDSFAAGGRVAELGDILQQPFAVVVPGWAFPAKMIWMG